MLRDCFSFSLLFSFLVRVKSARNTRVHALRFLLPGKLHFEKSIFDPSLFLSRAYELHTTKNIYALTRGYVHGLAMNYLRPIVYDLFHDKGRIEGRNRGDG